MKQHPVHTILTPDPAETPVPPSFTALRVGLPHGLPVPLEVPGLGLTLLLSAPTARIRAWLTAEAEDVAAESALQHAHFPKNQRGDDPRAALAPVLIVTRGKTPLALMPLIANARTLLPRAGGVALEIVLRSFLIPAEAMRGPSAGAGFIELAWRRIDVGTDAFMAPIARPAIRRRLVATIGTGSDKTRRAVAADFFTEAGTDPRAQAMKGGISWRLTHD
jgi:hypothetical protein